MKLKVLSIILISLFIITGCGAVNNDYQDSGSIDDTTVVEVSLEQPEDNPDSESKNKEPIQEVVPGETRGNLPLEYTEILDTMYKILESGDENYQCDEGMTGICEVSFGMSPEETMKQVGFLIKDIDGNGVNELLIVDNGEETWANRILNIYTTVDNEAVLLIEGWARNRYYMLDENVIYNEGSSGAAYTEFGTYRIADDGRTIEAIDTYFTDFNDTEEWGWFHNDTGSTNPEESEWLGTDEESSLFPKMEEMCSNVKDLEITYFCEYLDTNR